MIINEADEALEKHPFPFWTTYASDFPVFQCAGRF
jgi:hypothetical protein